MAPFQVQRDVPGTWCLDLVLGAMLLAASAAWAGILADELVGVDLALSGAFLLAATAFALRGAAGFRRAHPRRTT